MPSNWFDVEKALRDKYFDQRAEFYSYSGATVASNSERLFQIDYLREKEINDFWQRITMKVTLNEQRWSVEITNGSYKSGIDWGWLGIRPPLDQFTLDLLRDYPEAVKAYARKLEASLNGGA